MKTFCLPTLRTVSLLILLFLIPLGAFCQENSLRGAVPDEYTRPSVTFFITKYPGDINSQKAGVSAAKISFTDKYFNHNLNNLSIEMSQNFKGLSYDKKKAALKDYLESNGIGREILAKWFSRQPDGMFNLDYIHQCGLYNASDQDVLMSDAAKRGIAVLEDAGQKLVNKSYVLFLVPHEFTSFDDKTSHGWNAVYDIFVFKYDFDNEVVNRFYSVWPFEDDPDEVRQAKIAAFDTLSFTFTPFYGKPANMSSATEFYALVKNPKTSAQLFDEAIGSMYTNALFNIDKDLEPFRVKVNVSGTHPIRSKIGKKEGLHADQRFYVYEYVWSDKSGTAEQHRKAVIRATGKIADNRTIATGASPESNFYQVYGGTVRQGMLIQQRNDFGISAVSGYELGGIGGFNAGLWVRSGMFTNIPMLYAMVNIGIDAGDYQADSISSSSESYAFFRYSVGLGKGIRLARIVELIPYAAWGQESTSNDDYKSIKTNFFKGGGMLGISVTRNVSLLGQINFYGTYGGVTTQKDEEEKVTHEYNWTDEFDDRSGMSMLFGVRIEF